jgi:DNA-binding NarL/FixJ family response regulator
MEGPTSTNPARRILVVDEHPLLRLAIRTIVAQQADLTVCGEVAALAEAVETAIALSPDLAVAGLRLGTRNDLELVRRLHHSMPALPILVLSAHEEPSFIERAIRAGARGYLLEYDSVDGLVPSIRRILAGNLAVSNGIAARVADAGSPAADTLGALTDREVEVFGLIGRGFGTRAIAERLNVGVKSVETYRSKIRNKLKLQNAAELVRYATIWAERF